MLLSKSGDMSLVYERRSAHFAQESQRRKLTGVFQRMLLRLRRREDAERAANEFSHARLLPGAWAKLTQAGEHIQEHNKWARDAAFYVGTKKIVDQWRHRTEQSKQDKRRLAYDQVRSRIKLRLMRSAFAMLRGKGTTMVAAQFEADRLAHHRSVESLRQALLFWQQRTADVGDMHIAAVQHDIQKLRRSALLTIEARTVHIKDMTDLSTEIRAEDDVRLMATTYKRLRATGFALARLKDSSNVFHERLRERHRLQMLRHFAQLALERRAKAHDREPDSPSIRPASRAASRSDSRPGSAYQRSPIREATGTPAYLRTPSRARRSRFKAIPTPAPYTPFAFTPAYLTTTPAPQQTALASGQTIALEGLTPQITPFNRKLRANGIATDVRPASILRSRPFGRSIGPGTDKSVRFASRFQRQQPSSVIQEAE
ncbi:hypothetical protein AMS68_002678 [Peltaster fructicola]|uniref:Sfi1 spindle body domain-containing protein n=1 Tax=Peltaster fructicola TaxID=286661 RepID=A0A6H0XR81_9PEZI|nr:hypothetical protein AMS68_002678 [Peltaster fructicola]